MTVNWKKIYPFAIALLVTLLTASGIWERLDKWAQDALFQRSKATSGDIVIIGIDEETLAELGPYNSWDRTVMASALEALTADPDHLPAVTAIDVLYAGTTTPEADARLTEAADKLGNVITATLAKYGEAIRWENGRLVSVSFSSVTDYEEPFRALCDCTVQGHINVMYDTDGVMRHGLLYVEPDGNRVYSMACEAARLFQESRGEKTELPPVDEGGYFYIPYKAGPGGFYDDVSLADLIRGEVPPEYWAGKIVLIGPYAAAMQDAYYTPADRAVPMYGVEIQANIIQSLLDGNFKREAGDLPQLIILFLLCAAVSFALQRLPAAKGFLLCAGLAVLGIAGSLVFYRFGLVTHVVWLVLCLPVLFVMALVWHYVRSVQERQALALEQERINADLSLAARIQASTLPKDNPAFPDRKEFDISASMTPAKEVGGDLYDYYMPDEDHLVLVIADVSGKGVPAALFMMVAKALIHQQAMRHAGPAQILQEVNNEICTQNPEDMFVTAWIGILEISSGKLTAANAGHEYPMLKKAGEHFQLFRDKHGFVIGGMEGMRYREYELQLEPGEKLFVYTDGLAEAVNAEKEMYGTDRAVSTLQSWEDQTPAEIVEGVNRTVKDFVGTEPQFDDLTMLCLAYYGPAPGRDE